VRFFVSTPTLTAGVKATVLVDLLPKSSVRSRAITRDVVLVLGFALLTAAAAQVQFSLGFTPVPLTGQTFAVLLSGAALGMRRGIASQAMYWGLGLTGLPFYAGGDGGWQNGTGSTLGYFVGFIVAADQAPAIRYLKRARAAGHPYLVGCMAAIRLRPPPPSLLTRLRRSLDFMS
jgi:biotin transport system substrate-specific component